MTDAALAVMSEHSQVVVGFDFSVSARAALERAIALATRAPWHVLQIVSVIDSRHGFPALPTKHVDIAYVDRVQEAVSTVVTEVLASSEAQFQFCVHARIGNKAAEEILDVAQDVGADLIIVGSKGLTGVERAVLGSVAERIVREAHCTVEVARPKTYQDVPLLQIVDAEPHHGYAPPHRYSYRDGRALRRPNDWPLY